MRGTCTSQLAPLSYPQARGRSAVLVYVAYVNYLLSKQINKYPASHSIHVDVSGVLLMRCFFVILRFELGDIVRSF